MSADDIALDVTGHANNGDKRPMHGANSRKAALLAPAPACRMQEDESYSNQGGPMGGVAGGATTSPGKRTLFEKGPAFRSKIEDVGHPGSVHYETAQLLEDRPERMLAAANKALGPTIVTEAQKDTAMLLQLFAEGAARAFETSTAGALSMPDNNDTVTSGQPPDDVDVKAEKVDVLSLLCEEDGVDEVTEEDAAAAAVAAGQQAPKWYADSEKRVLEQCARTLFIISKNRRRTASNTHLMKRRKVEPQLSTTHGGEGSYAR